MPTTTSSRFELCCGELPLIVDPGTGTYYEYEEERLRFRSTGFHSTLRVDGAEQNELPAWPRFPLGNRSRAEAIEWAGGGGAHPFRRPPPRLRGPTRPGDPRAPL